MTAPIDDTWIVVADAGRARIFRSDAELSTFEEIAELVQPGARLKTSELVTDTPGIATRFGANRSGLGHHESPHDQEEVRAANDLAQYLDEAYAGHRYTDLVLVASPVFLGRLRHGLAPLTTRSITASVDRDYTGLPAQEIRELVKKHLLALPLPRR